MFVEGTVAKTAATVAFIDCVYGLRGDEKLCQCPESDVEMIDNSLILLVNVGYVLIHADASKAGVTSFSTYRLLAG